MRGTPRIVDIHRRVGRRSRQNRFFASPDQALLAELVDRDCRAPRVFRHAWADGDIVAWNNRCVLHRGHRWPFDQPRVMKRTGVGDNPRTIGEAGRGGAREACPSHERVAHA